MIENETYFVLLDKIMEKLKNENDLSPEQAEYWRGRARYLLDSLELNCRLQQAFSDIHKQQTAARIVPYKNAYLN